MPSLLVIVSALSAFVVATLAVLAARRRDAPGAASFAVLMLGAFVWAGVYAVALATFDPALRRLLEVPIEVGKALVAPAWLTFALGYTGYGAYVTRRSVTALMVVPVVTVVLTATNGAHGLMWTGYRIVEVLGAATAAYDPGPWFYFHALYGYALIAVGLVLVLGRVLSRDALHREQALALAIGSTLPTVANLARVFRLGPLPTADFTPPALAITGVAFGYAFLRLDLFGFSPATRRLGRRAALDDVGVAVAVVSADGRVVDLNAAAERVLDCPTPAALRRPLDDILDDRRAEAPAADGSRPDGAADTDGPGSDASAVGLASGDLVVLGTPDGHRTYEVTVSSVAGSGDRPVGRTVTLHDVTERERRRQRLEVLNRVLRHNLRNGLAVVLGNAETLAADLDGDEAERARAIVDRANDLADLGETARTVERMMAASTDPPARFDAVDVVRRAVRTARSEVDGAATIALDAPDDLPVVAREAVFRPVVAELIANAVEHHDGTPRAEVTVAAASDTLVVTVADDGPGIDEAELAAVAAGGETSLSHGSGLGLWLVTWGADALGADLDFADREPRGTVVTLRLPGACV
ncbi:MAG: histidine kinase N-terminal 7TM domain-containing protein [Haloferacaceae archaeon]